MNSIYCKEIEVKAMEEDVCLYLFEESEDKNHAAFMSLDIETAEVLYKILGQEIAKVKDQNK